ncbi:hypothetical protein JCM8547_002624 [Rhodosporidiobolus lusitaniae]
MADAKLRALSDSLSATLALLKRPRTAPSSSSSSPCPSLSDIRNDTLALLQLASKETTNLSLALKPPVSTEALEKTVHKLADIGGKVRFISKQLPAEGILSKRISWLLQESLEALLHVLTSSTLLLTALSTSPTPLTSKSPLSPSQRTARESLLSSAKAFWSTADRAEKLPASELEAVRGSWKDALEMMDDALQEVKEMGSAERGDAEGEKEKEEGAEEEEEEDEDDFASTPLSVKDRERISAAHLLLRLTRLLIHRLFTRTTPSPSSSPSSSSAPPASISSPSFLSSAHSLVQRLSALTDDIAAALEEGEEDAEEGELEQHVEELCWTADELQGQMEKALSGGGAAAESGKEEGEEKAEKEKQWGEMWRKQRDDARKKLEAI